MSRDLGLAYLMQARADWASIETLRVAGHPQAQWLHMLQMAAEKLGKSYLAAGGATLPDLRSSHMAFARALRKVPLNQGVADDLGMARKHMKSYIEGCLPLAQAIERLAPALAHDGPNPEYPWPGANGIMCPATYRFPIVTALNSEQGRRLFKVIDRCLFKWHTMFGL